MKSRILWLIAFSLILGNSARAQEVEGYYRLRTHGEECHAAGDLLGSLEAYTKASKLPLSPLAQSWVEFRIANATWRTKWEKDQNAAEKASQSLKMLLDQSHDRIAAEISESLADYYWTRSAKLARFQDALPLYTVAARFWLSSLPNRNSELRLLTIFGIIAEPPWRNEGALYGDFGNWIPIELLDASLAGFKDKNALFPLHYLRAKTLSSSASTPEEFSQVDKEYRAAIVAPKGMPYLDDALFDYARFLDRTTGLWESPNSGNNARAQSILRELVRKFALSSPLSERANTMLKALNAPYLELTVKNFDTKEVPFIQISSRGISNLDFGLTRLTIKRDFDFSSKESLQNTWLGGAWSTLLVPQGPAWVWNEKLKNGTQALQFRRNLPPSAYLLTYRDSRSVFFVTDILLVPKISGNKTLSLLAMNLTNGSPEQNASVTVYEKRRKGLDADLKTLSDVTDSRGIVQFQLPIPLPSIADKVSDPEAGWNLEFAVLAESRGNQAFLIFGPKERPLPESATARAFLSAESVSPGEPVIWSLIAHAPSPFFEATLRSVRATLIHPHGAKIKVGQSDLDEFGRASGIIRIPKDWLDGVYSLVFTNEEGDTIATRTFTRRSSAPAS